MTDNKSILIPSPHGWAPAMSLASKPANVPIAGQVGLVDPYRLFGGKGPTNYNPSDLVGRKGLRIFDIMRKDEQIKAAVAFKKHAILAAGYDIVSPEGLDDEWEPRRFVDWNFDDLKGSMTDRILDMLLSVEYGFSVGELLWGEITPGSEDVGPLTRGPFRGKWPIHDIASLKPHSIEFVQNEKGRVLGIRQRDIGQDIDIQAEKLVIMTYQNEWANPYGRSDLEACYDDWWGKTNARKWLAMFLERFGIPPIFFFYNPARYDKTTQDTLKDIIKNLQAGTSSIIPRPTPGDIEPWTANLGSHVWDVFIPALDRYDKGMARGILMPNLMGATPDERTGSFARAAVVFDVFMFAVEALRAQVEEVINDQIIWRMMSVNYPTDADEYPRFKFKPLTQDSRITLMDTWTKLVEGRAVINRVDDEDHIREIMGFPSADSEPIPPPEPPPGLDGNPIDKAGLPNKGKDGGNQKFSQKQINFKAIEKRLDALESGFIKDAKAALSRVLSNLQDRVRNGLPYETLSIVDLWARGGMMDYAAPLEEMLVTAFEAGQQALAQESGHPVAQVFDQSMSRVRPAEAIAFLKRKAITLTATLEDEILKEVRRVLISGIESGMSTGEVVDALAVVFEKWVGSEVLRDGEVIKPYRLEAIARTESVSAYNAGRVVAARDPELKGLIRGLRHDSILDSRTSEVCQSLNGRIHRINSPDLDALTPPLHPNCRSILTPITISRTVDESEFITPSEVGRAKELAGSGFAGGGSF